jgi:sugar transferase EpsL
MKAKRFFDLILTVAVLMLIWPFMLLLALMVRIKLGSPILYRQQRPGLLGRPFLMYKFRSMSDEKDFGGNLLPDADRLLPFGNFLRSTSFDELPELVNVLKGDMSLVGPRPLLMEYLSRYTPTQARRHEVRPGITGLAQVNGRQNIKFSKRLEYDVWYVDHISFLLDIKIIFLTFLRVVSSEGVKSGQDVHEVDDLGLSVNPTSKIVVKGRGNNENYS